MGKKENKLKIRARITRSVFGKAQAHASQCHSIFGGHKATNIMGKYDHE
jgi:hypothetical protein